MDPDGMLTRVLTIVEDVTQIKALEALAESNRRDLEKIADLLGFDDSVCITFIQETKRILGDCRTELGKVHCSTQAEQKEIINTLFRFVHTIKGNSSLFNLNSIQEVAHKVEDYFAGLRDSSELSTLEAKDVTKLIQQVGILETELATYEDLRHRVLGRGKDGDENSKVSNGQLLWMQSILKRVCQTTLPAASDPQLQSLKTEAKRLLDSVGKISIRHYIKAYDDMLQQLAPVLNKSVKLVKFSGNCHWIEVDLMAQINEILIHCLRNALAHGIEPVDIRKAAGKPAEGEISLELWRSDGQLSVLVRDDGRGIHGEEIAKKAVAKGLVTEAKLKMMNQEEIISLVFSPGFSTTDQVNELSGRGVGLDAVRIFTESLGGTTIARGTPGLGLVIELKIPDPASVAKIKPFEIAIPANSDPNLLATLGKLCESQGQSVVINTYQAQSDKEILSHPPDVLKLAFISEEMLDSHSEWKDIIGEDDNLRIVLVVKDLLASRHEGLPAKRCLTVEGPLDECTIRAALSLVGDNSNSFVQLTHDRIFRSA
jgi:chemotaxis protein histidine kinase CheA